MIGRKSKRQQVDLILVDLTIPGIRYLEGTLKMAFNKVVRAIKAFTVFFHKKSWGPFVEAFEVTRFDHAFSVSWSQAAEDLAIMPILSNIPKGRYLDIGAHHPSRFSVTRHLYQSGWSGVNIDANQDLLLAFEQKRTRDQNLCCCVGNESKYRIKIFAETAISTVSEEWSNKFVSENNAILENRDVEGRSLRSILIEYFPEESPDFLNIDIEGADLGALESGNFEELDFCYWPKWILLEANAPVQMSLETPAVKYLVSLGYIHWLVLPFSTLLRCPDFKK